MIAFATSIALALSPQLVQDTSQVFGLDPASQQVVRSETGAFGPALQVVGSSGADVEALDFDPNGRHLWAVSRSGAEVELGNLDLGTGSFRARGSAPIAGPVTDMAAAPDGRTWYLAEHSGSDSVIWRGDVSGMTWQPWVTLPNAGPLAGISVALDGRILACESATGALIEIDPATGAPAVVATIQAGGDLPLGMDFDWATGDLFAVLDPGAPRLVTLDISSGAATTVEVLSSPARRPGSRSDAPRAPSRPSPTARRRSRTRPGCPEDSPPREPPARERRPSAASGLDARQLLRPVPRELSTSARR